jgi:hypothetical protein
MKYTPLVIAVISVLCLQANAQPMAGNGCMTKTNPNRVYQEPFASYGGLPTYKGYSTSYSEWTVQYDITGYPCFQWTQTTSNGCYIKTGAGSGSSSYTLGNYGYFTGFSGTICPIDDYTLPLAMIIGIVSFRRIRKKKISL